MKDTRLHGARPSPSMAVAIAALFVALGGTAWAVATVGPRDIQDDAVRARHIAPNSVHSGQIDNDGVFSADVRDGQVASRDIRDATVRGADVAADSLTGDDVSDTSSLGSAEIDESSLSEVPEANDADLLQGLSASALSSSGISEYQGSNCEVTATTTVCASLATTMSQTSDVLLIGAGEWYNGVNVKQDHINCSLRRDGVEFPGSPSIDYIHGPITEESVTLTAVVQNVPPGNTTFELACTEENGEVGLRDRMLSAVILR